MKTTTRTQLSLMMFLQFFIWGGWFVTLGTFLGETLGASGVETGAAFSTQSWGAIIAPFIIGLIADRYFNAERILGILHLIGAVLMFQLSRATDFGQFFPYVLGYMIVYMPTLALVNSVSFRQMADPAKEFPFIRVWGTIGWVVAGLAISHLFSWDSQEGIGQGLLRNTFVMTAIASAALGLFSFTLPKTPPKARSEDASIRDKLGLSALGLLKDRNFLVFFVSSVLICIPLAFYYQNTNPFLVESGVGKPTGLMTLGQVSEVFFMLLLPVFLVRYGIKMTLLVGMLAWALRYVLFAYGNADAQFFMLVAGIVLHGICYDFFFVTGQIYTDAHAGPSVRSSAQGFITLATYGVGMLIGTFLSGAVVEYYTTAAGPDWQKIWLFPAAVAFVVLVAFLLLFRERPVSAGAPSTSSAS